MRRLPDPELIALARKGSTDAAAVLFDRYWAHAWRAAYAVTADQALADDAAQEAIQKAFGALDRYDETLRSVAEADRDQPGNRSPSALASARAGSRSASTSAPRRPKPVLR
jgi:hypothetical protein